MTTFRELDGESEGASEPVAEQSSLGDWYESIKSLQIEALTDFDIARSVRQDVHLTVTIPEALRRLHIAPLAGDGYDGEIIAALASISAAEWKTLESLEIDLMAIWNQIVASLGQHEPEDEVIADAAKVSSRLSELQETKHRTLLA